LLKRMLAIFLISSLFGCSQPNPSPDLDSGVVDADIRMSVELSDDQTYLIEVITNDTEDYLDFSHPWIERFNGESWEVIPMNPNYGIEDEMIGIDPYIMGTNRIHLTPFLHPEYASDGELRVRRNVYRFEWATDDNVDSKREFLFVIYSNFFRLD